MDDDFKDIAEVFEDIWKACKAAVEDLAKLCAELLNSSCKGVREGYLIHLHPNKRLVHLALHHPKSRVRKKNRRRILKELCKNV